MLILTITKLQPCRVARSIHSSAFALAEALFAVAMAGIMVISLYAGISNSIFSIRLARENLRATEVMLEKMEVIRLLTWDQITSSNILPSTFTAPYYPNGTTNGSTNAVSYSGSISIGDLPATKVYSPDVKAITVNVSWKTGGLNRSRQLTTYVARYGIQDYVSK